ncbi:beta-ketoacyl-ACP synthase II [Aggregatibacter actinomycetemcomitans]|uniref:3-oxoacyl-ACP synthase n=3 Tax=Aggregatibacter actinomycetemcomitans TaxID=714 RepID=A0A142G0M8_AGGAC|nr:beta-ketoacyl-ACP synthase [Aggregatibacter actinomycetemcomitans]AFI87102.2 3-oxoacyl-ACP synthase [Aggregatibacter actinomycetemcomitans D7S-1]KYK97094.1 3-oxoacyl-ACP synthase [Aggregatibacter actinomycetemcomitans serotype d str. SA3733]AMQ94208.1 3-oxoacyl-ACP synthase [Aggregatibacter actinomycetemcomitans]ANU81560.1 beta-ketoacyl-ACP synthase II [Aggregatibacter actinomycetemcomitans]EKX98669.1 3-oxoacyl-(acyl carrier protein) synthase II [Aggregatibacter actinomycetemcomitans Y4]
MKRVVITGIGAVTAFGKTWQEIKTAFQRKQNAVQAKTDWVERYPELEARLGAEIHDYQPPSHWNRKQLRSLGRVSQFAVEAAERALANADLLDENDDILAYLKDGRMGVACGSSTGSTNDIKDAAQLLMTGKSDGFNANTYVRMMPHTTAANIGIFFGLTGRIIPTSSACSSGSQGIGYAYESIKYGLIPVMLAGGAEEFCPSEVYVFDSLYAASRNVNNPSKTPRPYDNDRDGLVIGEGAGIFVLEELEHALARGANIIAEVVGYGANSDGAHVTRPQKDTMQRCMELALKDANLSAQKIGYVNGHGTATEQGDIAETLATEAVFGKVPLSSQKSYLGHTLGACGALESWFSIEMMRDGWFAPTINLDNIDERCGKLDYIQGDGRHIETDYVMNNNFAFGGVNTSLIFKRWQA